ncbi:hypothetical protein E6C64_11670 [Naasia lichenicola]|uniref:Cell envelope biogenesis protein OmpA n=1 Tax=Naasia lichenicola TaxID=2565933 RepID=A0A4S4FIK8_9MICO|nr:hypothetical protein E6C64_11670 [Naasia lichenicola]
MTLVAGAAVALAANAIIATSAVAAGADARFGPLTVPAYVTFTLAGLAAAYAGWRIVRARAAHPDRVLRVLVPLLAVLSFVPDGILLATGFIPGSSPIAVAGLALMHLVVVAVAVPVFRAVAPVEER